MHESRAWPTRGPTAPANTTGTICDADVAILAIALEVRGLRRPAIGLRPASELQRLECMRSLQRIPIHAWPLCLGVGATGCFLAPEPGPPQAQLEVVQPGPYTRGRAISFTADKSLAEPGEVLTVNWHAYTCAADRSTCDVPPFASMAEVPLRQTFDVLIPTRRVSEDEPLVTMAVQAEVIDSRGASDVQLLHLDVANQEPWVVLQSRGAGLQGRFTLGTPVRIEATGEDPDGDALDYSWSYEPASGSDPGGVDWLQSGPTDFQLTPDVAGAWLVSVQVTDELGDISTADIGLSIEPDRIPCIDAVEPMNLQPEPLLVERDAPPRRLAVLQVTDDLDGYPATEGDDFTAPYYGEASFRWFVTTPGNGGLWQSLPGSVNADYFLDVSVYQPGDRLSVRVEVDDRVGRDVACPPEDDSCSALPGCPQRVTWNLEVR